MITKSPDSAQDYRPGGDAMARAVDEILDATNGRPHIFNLGHGVRPETPIVNVERVLKILREG